MATANVNGIDLNYRLDGDGGETIVLVNGLADDLETWFEQVPDFLAAGYRVLRFDNRGARLRMGVEAQREKAGQPQTSPCRESVLVSGQLGSAIALELRGQALRILRVSKQRHVLAARDLSLVENAILERIDTESIQVL
jgi:hypothetical protein